jgi:spore coat polysaccharide biosynthesis protein SpsF (cytidylyltransferase family)
MPGVKNDVAVVIQARLGSNRFPSKVLAPLAGRPVISHVLDRVREGSEGVIVVAIPDSEADDPLYAYLKCYHSDVFVHRGSTWNVLQRFYEAARLAQSETIVRITADCPLLDSAFMRAAIHNYCASPTRPDYWGWANDPDGSDVEIMSFAALERCALADHPDHREHVTTGLRVGYEQAPAEYGDVKYSVDTVGDLRRCEALLETCGIGQRRELYSKYCRTSASTTVVVKTQR